MANIKYENMNTFIMKYITEHGPLTENMWMSEEVQSELKKIFGIEKKVLKVEYYTEKSIVVRGDTKEYKDKLKELGGRWNSSLTDKETGEKFGGWIFSSKNRKEIESFIENM